MRHNVISSKPTSNEIEAANRAEVMALLIRAGYRVYRPEADAYGEDLILRTPNKKLLPVQLKSRMTVNHSKYGNKGLWMLFPSTTFRAEVRREWFLIRHDALYDLIKSRHGKAASFKGGDWSCRDVPSKDREFLARYIVA